MDRAGAWVFSESVAFRMREAAVAWVKTALPVSGRFSKKGSRGGGGGLSCTLSYSSPRA